MKASSARIPARRWHVVQKRRQNKPACLCGCLVYLPLHLALPQPTSWAHVNKDRDANGRRELCPIPHTHARHTAAAAWKNAHLCPLQFRAFKQETRVDSLCDWTGAVVATYPISHICRMYMCPVGLGHERLHRPRISFMYVFIHLEIRKGGGESFGRECEKRWLQSWASAQMSSRFNLERFVMRGLLHIFSRSHAM